MKRLIPLAVLALLVIGCTGREVTGPTDPNLEPEPEEPQLLPGRTLFAVTYVLDGTYAACSITYLDPTRTLVTLPAIHPPWTLSFTAEVPTSTDPFEATLSATCADPSKNGKAYVGIFIDDEIKASDGAAGYGATARTNYTIWCL